MAIKDAELGGSGAVPNEAIRIFARCHNKFAIGAERGTVYHASVFQRLADFLSGSPIPASGKFVVTGGQEDAPVRTKTNRSCSHGGVTVFHRFANRCRFS